MKRRIYQALFILCCIRMTVSCGTIIHGTTQDVDVRSNPDNAEVWVNGAKIGSTPTRLTLKRNTVHNIKIVKEGFKDIEIKINSSVSSWIIGNIVFGGLIGCGIDLASGGAYELKPESLDVNLVKAMAYNGESFNIPQYQLDDIKEINFIDNTGKTLCSVSLSWVE